MIFMNMAYPGKSYRVQVYDDWLGEEFEPMDNPKDGDKIVYRILGENGQPVEQKTEVYQNGEWKEVGGGGQGDDDMKVYELNEYLAIPNATDVIADISDGKYPVLMFNNNGTKLFWIGMSASSSAISAYGADTQNPASLKVSTWKYIEAANEFQLQI